LPDMNGSTMQRIKTEIGDIRSSSTPVGSLCKGNELRRLGDIIVKHSISRTTPGQTALFSIVWRVCRNRKRKCSSSSTKRSDENRGADIDDDKKHLRADQSL
jgi:hypothetical protein